LTLMKTKEKMETLSPASKVEDGPELKSLTSLTALLHPGALTPLMPPLPITTSTRVCDSTKEQTNALTSSSTEAAVALLQLVTDLVVPTLSL